MSSYIVQAQAQWIKWSEHPHGKRADITEPKSRELNRKFNADNITDARKTAHTIYNEFCEDLPRDKGLSLTGINNLKISEATFAKIYPL